MTTDFYEPNADRLTVGTRVRVRVSPECLHESYMTHRRNEQTGVIRVVYPANVGNDRMRSHRFEVETTEDYSTSGYFAAVELEPLGERES